MELTKYQFLNDRWTLFIEKDSSYSYDYTKEQLKEKIIRISDNIETTLKREIDSDDFDSFLRTEFKRIWIDLGYEEKLKKYQNDFIQKLKLSFDKNKMLDLAISDCEMKDLNYRDATPYLEDHTKAPKLGYRLAVDGENPLVGNLIFNSNYYFDYGKKFKPNQKIDSYDRPFTELLEISLDYKFSVLHRVCEGFLTAQKVHFLKELAKQISGQKNIRVNNEVEDFPEHHFEGEVQKIAWLYELGILNLVLELCKKENTFNWRKAGYIIYSFTGINADTVRKCLMAIYQTNSTNSKNNPLNNPENKLFLIEMRKKFKLNK